MLNQPTKEELDKIPKIYETENIALPEKDEENPQAWKDKELSRNSDT